MVKLLICPLFLSPFCFSFLFLKRYVLESGEYRLAVGPDTDCRSTEDGADPSLCPAFSLSLTDSYAPVCDYACGMWKPADYTGTTGSTTSSPTGAGGRGGRERGRSAGTAESSSTSTSLAGICGNVVAENKCRSTCKAQNWDWNYVDCLEQYYMGMHALLYTFLCCVMCCIYFTKDSRFYAVINCWFMFSVLHVFLHIYLQRTPALAPMRCSASMHLA
jgi:hypothetical protein